MIPTLRLFPNPAPPGMREALFPHLSSAGVEKTLLPAAPLADRIRVGEIADVAILMADMIDALVS